MEKKILEFKAEKEITRFFCVGCDVCAMHYGGSSAIKSGQGAEEFNVLFCFS